MIPIISARTDAGRIPKDFLDREAGADRKAAAGADAVAVGVAVVADKGKARGVAGRSITQPIVVRRIEYRP